MKNIDSLIAENTFYILGLFIKMLKINTSNPPGNELQLASLIKKELDKYNIFTELEIIEEQRANVCAVLKLGRGGKRLLFNSHLDVVPVNKDLWETDPFHPVVKNGIIYARGAADAKGGLVAMVAACILLKQLNPNISGELVISGVMGEETGGIGTKYWVAQGGRVDAAVVGEPTNLQPIIAHRGAYRPTIIFKGEAAHSSQPELGENALNYAANFICETENWNKKLQQQKHPLVGFASVAATIINGGIKVNVIPDTCQVTIDRRLLPGEKFVAAKHELLSILNKLQAKGHINQFEIRQGDCDKESAEVSPDSEIVRCLNHTLASMGISAASTGMKATTDMYILTNKQIPTVICGPGDMQKAHTANESIPFKEILLAIKVYILLSINYFK